MVQPIGAEVSTVNEARGIREIFSVMPHPLAAQQFCRAFENHGYSRNEKPMARTEFLRLRYRIRTRRTASAY